MKELLSIVKDEGLEVLQLEKRELDVEEAIYFKSRMIGQTEHQVLHILGV